MLPKCCPVWPPCCSSNPWKNLLLKGLNMRKHFPATFVAQLHVASLPPCRATIQLNFIFLCSLCLYFRNGPSFLQQQHQCCLVRPQSSDSIKISYTDRNLVGHQCCQVLRRPNEILLHVRATVSFSFRRPVTDRSTVL